MTKRMLVDATHPEETRVAVVDGNWLSDFDFERASRIQLKGNIYLAKVIRVEPSLQAAFVEYGGNRHGFLPFAEIHPDYFRIPMADRPHEEVEAELAEDAEDDAADAVPADDIQAYASEAAELALVQDQAFEPLAEETIANAESVETPVGGQAASASAPLNESVKPLAEFAGDPEHDVGLITDFGNAATGDMATPIETIGGEVAADAVEEAQRVRRPRMPRYKIQEVVKRRQVMLIQVVKEERGNKGAALTTFLSLAGRYCVLMPNTDSGGGVSRKITSHQDRRRMKEMLDQLEIPEGMAVILRTAGMEQEPAEIQRDLEYLLRLWNNIREQTLISTAPTLIYEEANLIKRTLRDLYSRDLGEILVAGQKGYQLAIDFMRTIMPDQLDKIKLYEDPVPLFFRYNVEKQIDQLYSTTVQLRSGGYIVINPTEALVSIDVNSGRATRERHIESTALKTNLEAAEEIGRQLRLRDLAGLIVIDFIDMEDGRNNAAVERRIKEAMRADRARLQIGRISPFGLLELSRQRLHPSLMEINFEKCLHCAGVGLVRSVDSAAISVLRVIEEEGLRNGSGEMVLHVSPKVALYILNQKRLALTDIENRYKLQVLMHSDDTLVSPDYKLERSHGHGEQKTRALVNTDKVFADTNNAMPPEFRPSEFAGEAAVSEERADRPRYDRNSGGANGGEGGRRRGRYGNRDRDRNRPPRDNADRSNNKATGGFDSQAAASTAEPMERVGPESETRFTEHPASEVDVTGNVPAGNVPEGSPQDQQRRGRRRGRRGGRNRRPNGENGYQGQGVAPRGENGNTGERPQRERFNRERQHNPPSGGATQANPGNYQPVTPVSIHDIDTTPRYDRPASSTGSGGSASQSSRESSYQVVSESADDKPKGGWWRRLTGQ